MGAHFFQTTAYKYISLKNNKESATNLTLDNYIVKMDRLNINLAQGYFHQHFVKLNIIQIRLKNNSIINRKICSVSIFKADIQLITPIVDNYNDKSHIKESLWILIHLYLIIEKIHLPFPSE